MAIPTERFFLGAFAGTNEGSDILEKALYSDSLKVLARKIKDKNESVDAFRAYVDKIYDTAQQIGSKQTRQFDREAWLREDNNWLTKLIDRDDGSYVENSNTQATRLSEKEERHKKEKNKEIESVVQQMLKEGEIVIRRAAQQ